MRPFESRWPAAGFLAGALCLAIMSFPTGALAQDDEDNDDAPQSNNGMHVYEFQNDDDSDAGADAAQPGGYLGVRVQDVTRDLQEAKDLPTDQGALVNTVDSDGPAGEAGIKRGDVIVQVNKKEVTDSGDLIKIVRGIEPGTKVPVVVIRDGDRKTLTVTIAPRPNNVFVAPPHGGHMTWNGMPPNIDLKALDGLRAQRQEIMKELDEIQQQLSELRQTDFTKLEAEIQALRDEVRRMQSAPKQGQKTAPK